LDNFGSKLIQSMFDCKRGRASGMESGDVP
jgi:hypothetical protein